MACCVVVMRAVLALQHMNSLPSLAFGCGQGDRIEDSADAAASAIVGQIAS